MRKYCSLQCSWTGADRSKNISAKVIEHLLATGRNVIVKPKDSEWMTPDEITELATKKTDITCELCKESFKVITRTHLKKHGMTPAQYLERYKVLESEETTFRKTIRNQHSNGSRRGTLRTDALKESVRRTVNEYYETHDGPRLGKKHTAETIAKLKAKVTSTETRLKMQESRLAYLASADGKFFGTIPEKLVLQYLESNGISWIRWEDAEGCQRAFSRMSKSKRCFWQCPVYGTLADIYFPDQKLVIEVDGCYWHCHDCLPGNKNPKAWQLEQRERDTKNMNRLTNAGYTVARIWECEVKNRDFSKVTTALGKEDLWQEHQTI